MTALIHDAALDSAYYICESHSGIASKAGVASTSRRRNSFWVASFTRDVPRTGSNVALEVVEAQPKCKGDVQQQLPLVEPKFEGRWTACQLEKFEVAVQPGIVQSMRVCLTETVSAAKAPQL